MLFLFDAFGIDKELLMDAEILETSMRALVSLIGMHMLGEPFVGKVTDCNKTWGRGVTILIPLIESHLALHTRADEGKVHFDLFSCKDFNRYEVEDCLRLILRPKWWHSEVIPRETNGKSGKVAYSIEDYSPGTPSDSIGDRGSGWRYESGVDPADWYKEAKA